KLGRSTAATIPTHLNLIEKTKELNKCVPHELNHSQKSHRFGVLSALILCHKGDPFHDRVVTFDE
ncbi:hypothetical protein Angca_008701, partial [Angiostrongylus cantonensis]